MNISSEREARNHLIELVKEAKKHLGLSDPIHYENAIVPVKECYGITMGYKSGVTDSGAYFHDGVSGAIVVNPDHPETRRNFTFFHEISHHLIRRDERLTSFLHEYAEGEGFERLLERFCNLGAAEFLIPRTEVSKKIRNQGFSIRLVESLDSVYHASAIAIAIQLAESASHNCRILICGRPFRDTPPMRDFPLYSPQLTVQYSAYSPANGGKYRVRPNTIIPKGHIIQQVFDNHNYLKGSDTIPFRSGKIWNVDIEAFFYQNMVFATLNHDSPHSNQQPALFELE